MTAERSKFIWKPIALLGGSVALGLVTAFWLQGQKENATPSESFASAQSVRELDDNSDEKSVLREEALASSDTSRETTALGDEGPEVRSSSFDPEARAFQQRLLSDFLSVDVRGLQSDELVAELERKGFEVETAKAGDPIVGERVVVKSRLPEFGISYLESSFYEMPEGGQELNYLRYVIDPQSASAEALRMDVELERKEVGRQLPVAQSWELESGMSLFLVPGHQEAEDPSIQGTLVSFEFEIH